MNRVSSNPARLVNSLLTAFGKCILPSILGKPKMGRMETVPQPPKLLMQLRDRIRAKHYSIRTEASYIDWARRFILFHDKRHPCDLGAAEVEAFLTYLAVERGVSASTQNQAKSALLFLYKEVLGIALPWLRFSVWHKRTRVPFVPMRWRDGCARY